METLVREAVREDHEDLCRLFAEADEHHREALPGIFRRPDGPCRAPDYIAGIIEAEDKTLLIAERGGVAVGCAQVLIAAARDIPILVPRRYAVIDSIVVSADARRQGIGRRLLEGAEQWALARGVNAIELNVWEFNAGAMRFYGNHGYRTASRKMWKDLGDRNGPETG